MSNLIIFIIFFSFNFGIWENILNMPQDLSGYIVDSLLIILMVLVFLSRRSYNLNFVWLLLIFLSISIISKIINNSDILLFIVGMRRYLIPPLMFFIGLNIKMTNQRYKELIELIIILFLLQIPMTFYKFFTVGMQEQMYIGTLANYGGAISTILPLMGMTLFLVRYLETKKKINLLLIFFMLFFGVVGLKRALVFFAPVIAVLSLAFYYYLSDRYKLIKIFNIKNIINVTLFSFLILYVGLKIIPTLNPENVFWGSFDINYAINYATGYEDRMDYGKLQGSGRLNAYEGVINYALLNSEQYYKLIFGIGPGTIERNSFNHFDQSSLESMGLGYASGLVGGTKTLLQFGVLGLFVYLLFLFSIIMKLIKVYKDKNSDKDKWIIIVIIWLFILTIDFIFYSHLILIVRGLYLPTYFLAGYFIQKSSLVRQKNNMSY